MPRDEGGHDGENDQYQGLGAGNQQLLPSAESGGTVGEFRRADSRLRNRISRGLFQPFWFGQSLL